MIVAKAGNDNLDGGPGGTDRLCGNTGDDHIHAKGSDKAFVSGGPGHDTCDVDHGDVVVDCEVVHRDTRPDHR